MNEEAVLGLENKLTLTTYPNPTKDVLIIELNESIKAIRVFDLGGNKLNIRIPFSNETNRKELDLSTLSTGTYLLQIDTPKGLISRRLIKE